MTDNPDRDQSEEKTALAPTRRQMIVALGSVAAGATAYEYGVGTNGSGSPPATADTDDHPASQFHVDAMTALANAVFPTSVSVDASFIETNIFGRIEPRPGHFVGLIAAIEAVDDYARARFGGRITELSAARRRQVLQSMGVTAVHPTADGTMAEQIRYYLVNDLLFALFSSPASSDLTGIDNPPGYPGGLETYQQAPGGTD